jgi:hypothetical protein
VLDEEECCMDCDAVWSAGKFVAHDWALHCEESIFIVTAVRSYIFRVEKTPHLQLNTL